MSIPLLWITFASATLNVFLTLYLLNAALSTPKAQDALKAIKTRLTQGKARIISPRALQAQREALESLEAKE